MSSTAHVAPGFPVVGVIGGGQLARMMQQPAIALGVGLRVLATSMEESAAQAVRDVRIGSHHDLDDLRRFADGCDVVTFDHEHVPPLFLRALEDDGVAVRPGGRALVHAQDKIVMREALTAAGVPCPRWSPVDDAGQLESFGAEVGWPLVLKTSRGGYDGRGVWVLDSIDEAVALIASTTLAPGARWLAEEKVDFVQELSAQVARSPHGQAVAYPVVRTVQTGW